MWFGCCSVFLVLLCLTVVALVVLVLRFLRLRLFGLDYALCGCGVLLFSLGVCDGCAVGSFG